MRFNEQRLALVQQSARAVEQRTNGGQIFSNNPAVIRLAGAVLAEQHDDWATHHHYLSECSMKPYPTRDNDTASGDGILAIT